MLNAPSSRKKGFLLLKVHFARKLISSLIPNSSNAAALGWHPFLTSNPKVSEAGNEIQS